MLDRERDARAGRRGAARADCELPAIVYQEVPARQYPPSDLAAHLFGYVGEVNEAQLARADYQGIEPGAMVGQAGVEQAYNKLLMGKDGDQLRRRQQPGPRDPRRSARSCPSEGRRAAADHRRRPAEGGRRTASAHAGFNGAAVILDPRNGEVLSLRQPAGLRPERVRRRASIARPGPSLNTDKLQAAAEPRAAGTLLARLDVQDRRRDRRRSRKASITPGLPGALRRRRDFYGRFFQCHLKGGHGTVDLRHAIEKSCNVYFYTVGNMLGVDRIHKWASALGLAEQDRHRPAERVQGAWCRPPSGSSAAHGEKWYPGETISVSIGQGQVSVTPLVAGGR